MKDGFMSKFFAGIDQGVEWNGCTGTLQYGDIRVTLSPTPPAPDGLRRGIRVNIAMSKNDNTIAQQDFPFRQHLGEGFALTDPCRRCGLEDIVDRNGSAPSQENMRRMAIAVMAYARAYVD